jgi:hypothetical protein
MNSTPMSDTRKIFFLNVYIFDLRGLTPAISDSLASAAGAEAKQVDIVKRSTVTAPRCCIMGMSLCKLTSNFVLLSKFKITANRRREFQLERHFGLHALKWHPSFVIKQQWAQAVQLHYSRLKIIASGTTCPN